MQQFFTFFGNMWFELWELLEFEVIDGVYFTDLILVLMIIGFAVTVFWKGAKT